MRNYVAGLMFTPDRENVVLICKDHPKWQAGKWNAVGGKSEPEDTDIWETMAREFQEETGVSTVPANWRRFLRLDGVKDWNVDFFVSFNNEAGNVKQQESEIPKMFAIAFAMTFKPLVSNLKWIIPLALQSDTLDLVHVKDYGIGGEG